MQDRWEKYRTSQPTGAGAPVAQQPVADRWEKYRTSAPTEVEGLESGKVETQEPVEAETGISPGKVAAGLVGGTGAVYLASKLARAPGVLGLIGKGASALNSVRQQAMLSGFAMPKSLLGNVGAVGEAAVERGSMEPLKQFFSRQTGRDAVEAFKRGGVGSGTQGLDQGVGQSGGAVSKLLSYLAPGRYMGAMDEATQGALRRAGVSADDAQRATLQAPLPGPIAKIFDSPEARYFQPFRRTPINQVIEGADKWSRFRTGTMTPGERRAMMLQLGGGATHGAVTADEDVPLTLPLGVALAARGGLPYGLAAMISRATAGGKLPGSGIAGSLLPASEWGLESSVSDPLKPFRKPAALTALEKLGR